MTWTFQESAQSASDAEAADFRFDPTPEAKKAYHNLARVIHPDLALDAGEKERRHGLMAELKRHPLVRGVRHLTQHRRQCRVAQQRTGKFRADVAKADKADVHQVDSQKSVGTPPSAQRRSTKASSSSRRAGSIAGAPAR